MSELGVVELAKWTDHVQCDVIVLVIVLLIAISNVG
jgi:hypothetical protein